VATRRKVAKGKPKAKRKPLPIAAYVKRYGAPKKGHPRRKAYERTAAFKKRREAALKGEAVRHERVRAKIRKKMARLGEALDKASDVGAWPAFRRQLAQVKRERARSGAWRRMLSEMIDDIAEVLDLDKDSETLLDIVGAR